MTVALTLYLVTLALFVGCGGKAVAEGCESSALYGVSYRLAMVGRPLGFTPYPLKTRFTLARQFPPATLALFVEEMARAPEGSEP